MISIPARLAAFFAVPRLATLCTLRPDGTPHAVPVRATVADGLVRVLTRTGTAKLVNLATRPYAAVSEHEAGSWATVEGPVSPSADPAELELARRLYEARFQEPAYPADVVLVLRPARVLASRH